MRTRPPGPRDATVPLRSSGGRSTVDAEVSRTIGGAVATAEQVMHEYVRAVVSGGDFSRWFADDVVWTTMETDEQVRGAAAVRDHIVGLHRQAFDAHLELVRLVAGDGGAMLEAVFRGRHTGTAFGVPATGGSVEVPYAMAYDVVGERITALRSYFPVRRVQEELRSAAALASA